METLISILLEHAQRRPDALAYSFERYRPEPHVESLSWSQLLHQARLRAVPALAGERVLLFFQPGLELYLAFFAALYSGACPVVVPTGNPRRAERGRRDLETACRAVESEHVWTSPDLLPHVPLPATALMPSEAPRLEDPLPTELAYLQLTSGSTSAPRAVRITHANAIWMSRSLAACSDGGPQSVTVGWLPLFHDMGMVLQLIAPLVAGARSHALAPLDFLSHPRRWLEAIAEQRATHTAAPNFAYQLCLDRVASGPPLTSLIRAYNGGEAVRLETVRSFSERFGLRPDALCPCYGLAEATLMVSGGRRGLLDEVDGAVGCGPPLEGTEVEICNGEICVRSPGVSPGYLDEHFEHGWLRTGDLGFLRDGELFVTGRCKETLVLHGACHSPTTIEEVARAASRDVLECAAFSVPGPSGERLVLAVETRRPEIELVGRLRRALAKEAGVAAFDVRLVLPRRLPRTTSGKLQRLSCREAYLKGDL